MNYLFKSVKSSINVRYIVYNFTFIKWSLFQLHTKVIATSTQFIRQLSVCAVRSRDFQIKCSKLHPLKTVSRSLGYYCIHPEKMRQIVKERDAQALCHYFDSEKYKRKIQEMVEMQKKMVFEELPEGMIEQS